MDLKTYTKETVMVEFDADSEYGVAFRAMTDVELKLAVDKLYMSGYSGTDCWVVAVPQQYPFLPGFYSKMNWSV